MIIHRRLRASLLSVTLAVLISQVAGVSVVRAGVAAPVDAQSGVLVIENNGQFDPAARFLVLADAGRAWLTEDTLWMTVPAPAPGDRRGDRSGSGVVNLRVSFPGANPAPLMEPDDPLPAKVSFFLGKDPSRWRSSRTWGAVRYRDLYPGIDLVVGQGADRRFPWRLEAQPGADLRPVTLRLEGAERVVARGGALAVTTVAGELELPLPSLAATTTPLANRSIKHTGPAAFDVSAPYATAAVEPAAPATAADLLYSTFVGGSYSDPAYDIAINAAGDAVIAGRTQSVAFPTTTGAYDTALNNNTLDGFLLVLSPDGAGVADLRYATFFGGSAEDSIFGLDIDSQGRVYVTGETYSQDLPTTASAYDRSCGTNGKCDGWSDAFLAVFNPAGNGAADLRYSTFLGAEDEDSATAVEIAADGRAFLVGYTLSAEFPATAGAFDRTCGTDGACDPVDRVPTPDAFFARLNPVSGGSTDLQYATFLGGSEDDSADSLALVGSQVLIAGSTYSPDFPGGGHAGNYDAYVLRLNPAAAGAADLVYSRLLGGTAYDSAKAIAVNAAGSVTFAGDTASAETAGFPVTAGAYDATFNGGSTDAFLATLTATGSVSYVTFMGGGDSDQITALALDADGRAFLAGVTKSADFPVTLNAYDETCGTDGACNPSSGVLKKDVFAARFDPSLSVPLEYATFLGGASDDEPNGIALAWSGEAFIAGGTRSTDFPFTAGAYDTSYNGGLRDVFLSVLRLQPTGDLRITKVVEWNGITAIPGQSFQICVTGPGLLTVSTCKDFNATNGWVQTWAGLAPGNYTITEPGVGDEWDVALPAGPVTVAASATAFATVTNAHRLGSLEATKTVNWNDVPEEDDSFEICVSGPSHTTPSCKTITTAQVAAEETLLWEDLLPGDYVVTETAQDEWLTVVPGQPISVPADGTTTSASVSNTRKLGSLEITKSVLWNEVTPVDGTTFEICISGPSFKDSPSCSPFVYTSSLSQTRTNLIPGDYTVTEDPGSKWQVTLPGAVTVPADGTGVSATVTNEYKAGALVVRKVVVNDNGGTKVATDFSFQVNGGAATAFLTDPDVTPSDPLQGKNTLVLDAVTYSVTEPAVAGYSTTYDNCADIEVPTGGTVNCTITNDDQPATLVVKKVLPNDDGGAATAHQFSFSVNNGTATAFEADGQNDLTVDAGTYSVVETNPMAGYTLSYDNCTGVVISPGGSATCTITNDDQPATLIVRKVIVNGGGTPYSNFSFSVNGVTAQDFETDGQNDLTVSAGTYTVTEPAVAGYITAYDNCTDIVLPNGGTATCEITNTRILGSLTITKVVEWNGVTAVDGTTFTICIQGPSYPVGKEAGACKDFTYPLGLVQTWTGLIPGDYAVTETAIDGQPLTPATAPDANRLDARAEAAGQQDCAPAESPGSGFFLASYRPARRPSVPGSATAAGCKEFTYPDGLTQTWTSLVPGEYVVAETDPGSKWIVTIDNSAASVPIDGGSGTATVTNTRLPDLPPKAPQVSIAASGIDGNLTDARLTWPRVDTDESGASQVTVVRYLVWRSDSPYFVPNPDEDEPHGTVTMNLEAPSFTDEGVLAGKDFNYYYMVQAVSDADLSSDFSNRVGEFTFGLTPGS